ncbi:hypothetical protein TNCV_258001 [Trichonephila clavipes]|uniref:Uncharacterized protein n=1 Tax=Trichonephila clavipes TaxID=2585209 RepID=A0A8X6RQ74_TRICX|nr:hypothetical protein TNCV_258001 [Trichonephila clavipes]
MTRKILQIFASYGSSTAVLVLLRTLAQSSSIGMMTQQTAPWENWHLERGVELLRTFGLVRWGLGGSGHVEGTGEKLSFASQAAR